MTTITQTDATWQDDATVIGLVSLAHASSHFAHLLLPLMFPKFIETFGFSYSELGLLMSVFLFHCIGQHNSCRHLQPRQA